MQRRQVLSPPGFTANPSTNRRPSLYFPLSIMDPTQILQSSTAQNHFVIDFTTQNPQYASTSYKTPCQPQNKNSEIHLPCRNAHHQTGPPPQNQSQDAFYPKNLKTTKTKILIPKPIKKTTKVPRMPILL